MAAAVATRREQIKRWLDYYDGANSSVRKDGPASKRVRFPPGVVFLAAAQSGNIEETKRLLANGADPNSCTADGLTAHHQCCIDGNLDMLKVLVENGANVNAKDNEGWTPLHATASCDRADILEYLVENGADITSINNEGEIALDLCDEDSECLGILTKAAEAQNLSMDEAREAERRVLLEDAKAFKADKTEFAKSLFGATPLHVACAKGYDDVIRTLLESDVDLDALDDDGWTPLHAAAHWGEETACELLSNAGADFEKKTPSGQTVSQVADPEIVSFVERLQRTQAPKKKVLKTIDPSDELEHQASSPNTPRLERRRSSSVSRPRTGSQSKLDMSAERSKIAEFRANLRSDENKMSDKSELSPTITTTETKEVISVEPAVLKPPSFSPKPPSSVTTTAAETSATSDSPRSPSSTSTAASSERAPVASSVLSRREQFDSNKSNESSPVPLSAGVGRRTSLTDQPPSPKPVSVLSRLDSWKQQQQQSASVTNASNSVRDVPRKSVSDRLAQFGGGRMSPSTSSSSVATVAEPTSNAKTSTSSSSSSSSSSPAKTDGAVPATEAEPEAVRRTRARRSRENRRVTQHVRREDLMQATGSPSPDADMDDKSSVKSSDSREDIASPVNSAAPSPAPASPAPARTPDASANQSADDTKQQAAESAENGTSNASLSASEDQKSSGTRPGARHRRNRAKRRPTGIISLTGEVNSDSESESLSSLNLASAVPDLNVEKEAAPSHQCSCSSRLTELCSQLTSMTESFQADRQRMTNLEKELKQLREENRALIRVIAKLSRSST